MNQHQENLYLKNFFFFQNNYKENDLRYNHNHHLERYKLKHFKNNPKKINYLYILTPKGIAAKTAITLNFIKMRIKEYKELKREFENK